jgi:hypothetical protein
MNILQDQIDGYTWRIENLEKAMNECSDRDVRFKMALREEYDYILIKRGKLIKERDNG